MVKKKDLGGIGKGQKGSVSLGQVAVKYSRAVNGIPIPGKVFPKQNFLLIFTKNKKKVVEVVVVVEEGERELLSNYSGLGRSFPCKVNFEIPNPSLFNFQFFFNSLFSEA